MCQKQKQVTYFLHMTRITVFMEFKPTSRVNMTQCGKTVTVHWIFTSFASNYDGKNVMLKFKSGFVKFGCQANRELWAVRLVAVSLPQQQQRAAELL